MFIITIKDFIFIQDFIYNDKGINSSRDKYIKLFKDGTLKGLTPGSGYDKSLSDCDDNFYGYTSLSLPLVSNFVKFWDLSMKEDDSEYYLEIDEICILFKQWLNFKTLF